MIGAGRTCTGRRCRPSTCHRSRGAKAGDRGIPAGEVSRHRDARDGAAVGVVERAWAAAAGRFAREGPEPLAVRVWVLGSGSAGNAVLVESGDTRILIDAGFPVRELADAIRGDRGEWRIDRERDRHARAHRPRARRVRRGQAVEVAGVREQRHHRGLPALERVVRATLRGGSDALELGDLTVQTVRTPHDGTEPVAVLATARASGVRAGIVYDLGHVPPSYQRTFERLDILVLESNHDEGMLRAGPYPPVGAGADCGRVRASEQPAVGNVCARLRARGARTARARTSERTVQSAGDCARLNARGRAYDAISRHAAGGIAARGVRTVRGGQSRRGWREAIVARALSSGQIFAPG